MPIADQLRAHIREEYGKRANRSARVMQRALVQAAPRSKPRRPIPHGQSVPPPGRLKRSIQVRSFTSSDRVGLIAEARSDYASYVNDGTDPHTIQPVRAKVLAFPKGGKIIYTKIVHHPGTEATHFWDNTLERFLEFMSQ